jgi:alpha-1,6-mannosyltransferase
LIVLDITKYFGPSTGGIRTYLLEKAGYVAARDGLRQVAIVPGERDEVIESGHTRWHVLASPSVPIDRNYRFLWRLDHIRRIIRDERPDLIELGSPLLVPWLVRLATRPSPVPVAWFCHGNLPRIVAPPGLGGPSRLVQPLAWSYVRRVAAGCRVTLAASPSLAADLRAHRVGNVRQVALGVDLERFNPRRRAGAAATRRRYGLPDGPLVLYLGRRSREKQLHVPIRAWQQVGHRAGAALLLVGAGPGDSAGSPADRILCRPHLDDREAIADLLAAVDLYLAPGPAETFGLSALEALASGTPVLSVDHGGGADLVRASGAGALYPAGDPDGCAAAAVALLDRDLEALGTDARRFAERAGRWDQAFDGIFAAYREALA